MSEWQPLSVRRGVRQPADPHSGIPSNLKPHLIDWVKSAFIFADSSQTIDLAITLGITADTLISSRIVDAAREDDDLFLDVVDYLLHIGASRNTDQLARMLKSANSVWAVSPTGRELTLRVDTTQHQAVEKVLSEVNAASREISTAWSAAFGRSPDPSDAWDHAIKAVEAALWPIVTPDDAKATLGKMVDRLGRRPDEFSFRLATSSAGTSNIEALVQIVRLMWPNPDRHGTGLSRPPTPEEAENVVQLAVLLVGWAQSGALSRAS